MTKKHFALLLTVCLLLAAVTGCSNNKAAEEAVTIRVSGAWALYPMMLVWADEYQKVNENVTFEISGGGAGKGISDVLAGQVDIGMVSREIREDELSQGAFPVAVTKDTVVGIVNENNPAYDLIVKNGISQEMMAKIFTRDVKTWGEVYGVELENDTIVVYSRSDSSGAASVWALFLGDFSETDLQNFADSNVNGDQGIATSVRSDVNAISFTNINYVFNAETGGYMEALRPVPIDLNNDGTLSGEEQFYDTREALMENVGNGMYPSPPTREEYVVAKDGFTGAVKQFIDWILNDGQAFTQENGFIALPEQDRLDSLATLNGEGSD